MRRVVMHCFVANPTKKVNNDVVAFSYNNKFYNVHFYKTQ